MANKTAPFTLPLSKTWIAAMIVPSVLMYLALNWKIFHPGLLPPSQLAHMTLPQAAPLRSKDWRPQLRRQMEQTPLTYVGKLSLMEMGLKKMFLTVWEKTHAKNMQNLPYGQAQLLSALIDLKAHNLTVGLGRLFRDPKTLKVWPLLGQEMTEENLQKLANTLLSQEDQQRRLAFLIFGKALQLEKQILTP